ncbi:hypothetical protein Tco_1265927 [Tanacetum coccineum]
MKSSKFVPVTTDSNRNSGIPRAVDIRIEADVPLLGELGDEGDKPMVGPVVDEIVEPIVKMEEQVITLVIDIKEDIAVLYGDGNFSDDDSEGFEDEEEVWEVNEEWLMAPVTPPLMPVMPLPSTYEVGGPSTAAVEGQSFTLPAPGFLVPPSVIEDLRTRMVNLNYGHGQLVKKVIKVSDVVVADGITIGEIGSRVSVVEGQIEPECAGITGRCAADRFTDLAAAYYGFLDEKNHAMSDKSSPFKMSSFGKLFELEFSKEKSVFTPATDSCASNLTPIDCMERCTYIRAKRLEIPAEGDIRSHPGEAIKLANALSRTDRVDYASSGAVTLEF